MESQHKSSSLAAPRFWNVLQPSIIRVYKFAGLVALTAILLGLASFLITNIFYFFDHTWVRPVVLSPTHQKVMEASAQLNDAKLRESQLVAEKLEIEAQLVEIKTTIAADDAFIAQIGTAVDAPKAMDQWMVRREVDRAKLERTNAEGRQAPLHARLDSLVLRDAEQTAAIKRLEQSPYLRALDGTVVMAFVPNQNLRNVKIGTKLYACSWGLVACSAVGTVTATIEGEVQDIHPHDESIQRGMMVEIQLTTPSAALEPVLFAGGKPLWLF